ncbi:hypothetical protein BBU64B_K0006 (plasmid) [Borreliella burgdorferi 64b]|nr:hypothetical protein BBU64B_K0006 [Borreliella burgdorferi 64b]
MSNNVIKAFQFKKIFYGNSFYLCNTNFPNLSFILFGAL